MKRLMKKRWWQMHKIIQTKWNKFSSKIAVLVFLTTFKSYGTSSENFL